jgi:hypothetical protein
MEDIAVPIFYVVRGDLGEDQTDFLVQALKITPIQCVIICDAYDCELAIKLSYQVMRVPTLAEAEDLAERIHADFGLPVVIIAGAALAYAKYSDGTRQELSGFINAK